MRILEHTRKLSVTVVSGIHGYWYRLFTVPYGYFGWKGLEPDDARVVTVTVTGSGGLTRLS